MSDNAIVIGPQDLPQEVQDRLQEFWTLLDGVEAENPDPEVVTELGAWFDNCPGLLAVVGDMNAHVQKKIIERITTGNAARLAIEKGAGVMRTELGYDSLPTLERMLVDHVVTCRLRLQSVEWRYTEATSGSVSLRLANHWDKHLSAAQRRYLRACETLARVRKLVRQTPALQVNIAARGGQQVNVAGDVKARKR